MKEKGGSKACNIVNKFKLFIKKIQALILFLCPKPNGNQLLLPQLTLIQREPLSLNHM